MYQTQQALIDHLKQAENELKENGDPYIPEGSEAQDIKEYAGEFSGTSRQRVEYPAIFVLYREGSALQVLPDLQYELFFVAENNQHDNEKAKQSALQLAEPYTDFLTHNHEFEDAESYYSMVDPESANLTTLLNNHKWCILSLRSVTVQVNRQV